MVSKTSIRWFRTVVVMPTVIEASDDGAAAHDLVTRADPDAMSLVRLIDEPSAPLLLRDLYAGGDPGPIVGALAQVPELCDVALPFVGASLGPSSVSFRHKEIAILRTSANLACRFCIDAHTVVAFESGLSFAEVMALRECPTPSDVFHDSTEQALIAWIDALSTQRGLIADDVSAAARDALGEHRLVELTVTVGATMLLNRFASGLRLPTSDATLTALAELGFESYRAQTYQTAAGVTVGRRVS
jgi:AhpD family alkylhydroperoxidase